MTASVVNPSSGWCNDPGPEAPRPARPGSGFGRNSLSHRSLNSTPRRRHGICSLHASSQDGLPDLPELPRTASPNERMKKLISLSSLLLALASSAPTALAAPVQESSFNGYGRTSSYRGTSPSSAYRGATQRRARSAHRTSGYGCPPAPVKVWVPGRWTVQSRRVWVPGRSEQVWQPPVFETRFASCGRSFQIQVSGGYYRTIQNPGHWVTRNEKVWQAPRWEWRS